MTITSITNEAPDYFSQAESTAADHRKVELLTFSSEQHTHLQDKKMKLKSRKIFPCRLFSMQQRPWKPTWRPVA